MNVNLLATLFAACFSLTAHGQPSPQSKPSQKRKKVAVVLSGGGAKGMAHIGALRVIEKAGLPIDIITGTSMGSIVGGLYAIGYDSNKLDSMVKKQDWGFLLADKLESNSPKLENREKQNTYFLSKMLNLSENKPFGKQGGIIEGRNIMNLFSNLTNAYPDSISFDSLPIPFSCVATNIIDNSEYDIHGGVLAEAMRTSMSIPGVFAPIRKGGMVLVDGGLRNNFPVDIAKEMGADVVIGVTVQDKPKTADDLRTSSSVLMQIIDINCKNKYEENLKLTDVPINVNTEGFTAASFTSESIDTLIKRGETAAMKQWDNLMKLKKTIGIDSTFVPERPLLAIKAEPEKKKHGAKPELLENSYLAARLGARFDTEEMASLQMNATFMPKQSPMELEATLRLGKRITARADMGFNAASFGKIRLSYIFRHNDLDVYKEGRKDYNIAYNQHEVEASVLNFNIRNFNLDIGMRWDYYGYTDILSSIANKNQGVARHEKFFSYYALVKYNSENDWTFPTRGARFNARYSYGTDDFVKYKGRNGFSELSASWRMVFPLSNRFTLQPMLYGRMLFGSDIPMARSNVVGGYTFGRYMEQQMPFPGIGHIEYAENFFVAATIKAMQRISTRNYVTLQVSGAQQSGRLRQILERGPMMGYEAAYWYNSMLGPLGATVGYSSRTDKPYVYISLGFDF